MMDVGKKGVRFKDVAEKVAKFYKKKGYSRREAEEIGKKVAGKVFWRKFGKKRGREILRKARKPKRRKR